MLRSRAASALPDGADPSSVAQRFDPRELALPAVVGLWLVSAMPLFAQESYYWCYALHLDWSYLDHPPLIAWAIAAGSALLGGTAIGIRLGTFGFGMATVLVGGLLLAAFGVGPRGRRIWSLGACVVPAAVAPRFFASPDAPLVATWLLTMLLLWHARAGGLVTWGGVGLALGLALLSKYAAALLGVGCVLVFVLDAALRVQWRRSGPWIAIAVTALSFAPVVIWNLSHDLQSFRFQTLDRLEHARLGSHWFFEWLLGQVAAVHPLMIPVVIVAMFWVLSRTSSDVRASWLAAFALPLVGVLVIASLWIHVKINWSMPAVAVGLLAVASSWEPLFVSRWPRAARMLERVLVWSLVLPLLAPLVWFVPQTGGSSWTGWEEVAARTVRVLDELERDGGRARDAFVFCADYRDAAQLTRVLHLAGRHEDVLAENTVGRSALEFAHWFPASSEVGKDAVLVLSRPARHVRLVEEARERFASVKSLSTMDVERFGIRVRSYEWLVCRGYRGPGTP
jgi:dolichol-phosphate mannosyltransferase